MTCRVAVRGHRLRLAGTVVAMLAAAMLGGCIFGGDELRCEDISRIAFAGSVPPVQVPDDLSVPSENDTLQIPSQPPPSQEPLNIDSCLEEPPPFFDGEE